MNERFWPWLLLLAFSLFAPRTALAQGGKNIIWGDGIIPSKQSHHDLPGGLDIDNPQEMMAERLQGLHDLHQLQDQMQGLLKDADFLNNIKGRFSPEQLRQLQEKMLKGEGLSRDKNWNELLQQASSRQKLEPRQLDILRRWAERAEHKETPLLDAGGTHDGPLTVPPSSSTNSGNATPSPSAPPEPSLFDRMQEETTNWLIDHADDVGDDILGALVELGVNDEGTPLNELLRAMQQPDFAGNGIAEQAAGLSSYVPKVGEFFHEQRGAWDEVRSIFHNTPTPALPSVGGSSASAPTSAAADGDAWAPILSLLLLGAIVFLLCKMGLRLKVRSDDGADESWRLGSWPVSPDDVSTRQDVIRAFEYLALLCLGPDAGVCHHRALAARLAEQDNGNRARRQAAEMLAWLYEQARYAPADETLSQGELSDARHALCLLAGVATA
jgi:hypothetical protein